MSVGETLWDGWARVPESTKLWLYLHPRMLLPPAVWEEMQGARFGYVWASHERDGFMKLDQEGWDFIESTRPTSGA